MMPLIKDPIVLKKIKKIRRNHDAHLYKFLEVDRDIWSEATALIFYTVYRI